MAIGRNSGIVPNPVEKFPDGTQLTQDMGLLSVGYDISGLSSLDLLQLAYAEFVTPSFTSFNIAQSNIEVGTEISGEKAFSWSFDLPENVAVDSVSIVDVTEDTVLQNDLSKESPANVDIGLIVKNEAGSHSWRAKAIDTEGTEIQSSVDSVSWRWKRFWGFIDNQAPNDAEIKAASSELSTNFSKDWQTGNPVGEEYFFFAYPASFGDLNAISLNGFPSIAAFTKTTRDFENAQGISESYNIYVSNNLLNANSTIETS